MSRPSGVSCAWRVLATPFPALLSGPRGRGDGRVDFPGTVSGFISAIEARRDHAWMLFANRHREHAGSESNGPPSHFESFLPTVWIHIQPWGDEMETGMRSSSEHVHMAEIEM